MKRLLYLVIVTALLSSCAQWTMFQSARTEGKGNMTLTGVLEGSSLFEGKTGATIPGGRVGITYGITDRLDIQANVSSSLGLLTSLKYQAIGNNESVFSLSVNPGYEFQVSPNGGAPAVKRLHIPIVGSYYFQEDMGLTFAPSYILQIQEGSNTISYPGISLGINIDRRIKYYIGGGAFFPITSNVGVTGSVYQYGVSARIPIYSKK